MYPLLSYPSHFSWPSFSLSYSLQGSYTLTGEFLTKCKIQIILYQSSFKWGKNYANFCSRMIHKWWLNLNPVTFIFLSISYQVWQTIKHPDNFENGRFNLASKNNDTLQIWFCNLNLLNNKMPFFMELGLKNLKH